MKNIVSWTIKSFVILTAITFYIGWQYDMVFYNKFNLNQSVLNIPTYYYFIEGFSVIKLYSGWIINASIFLYLCSIGINNFIKKSDRASDEFFSKINSNDIHEDIHEINLEDAERIGFFKGSSSVIKIFKPFIYILILSIMLNLLSLISCKLANDAFKIFSNNNFSEFRNIIISMNSKLDSKKYNRYMSGCYKVIFNNNDKLFVLVPDKSYKKKFASTNIIPLNSIEYYEILSYNKTCSPEQLKKYGIK